MIDSNIEQASEAEGAEVEKKSPKELRSIRKEGLFRWQMVGIRLVLEGKLTEKEFARENARIILLGELKLERVLAQKERAKVDAQTDSLTNLPNRGAYDKRVKELIASAKSFGVMIIDVNGLKEINDIQGHQAGDVAIYQTGLTLVSGLRVLRKDEENDLVARYGGDEFIVLLPDVLSEENLEKIANKLITKFQSNDKNAPPNVSIGGGVYREGTDFDTFFQDVDSVQYKAKEEGKKSASRESKVIILENPQDRDVAA